MTRKFLTIATVAALAVTAFSTAAQAAPHYKTEGAPLPEGARTYITAWGSLRYDTVLGGTASYTCRNAAGGYVENPGGGGAGVGALEAFVAYGCVFSACPTYATVAPEAMPWTDVLTEPSKGKLLNEMGRAGAEVKVAFQCWASRAAQEKAAAGESELPNAKQDEVGVLTPTIGHGTSAAHPGYLEFGPGSGKLEQEDSSGTIQGEVVGRLRFAGYKEQELVDAE